MLSILIIVSPVFALVATGFLAVRFKAFPDNGGPALLSFVNNFATPCLLFRAMLSVDFSSVFNFKIITSFYAGAVCAFILGIVLSRLVFKNRPGESVSAGFAAMYSNLVLLGIPIIQRAYGEEALPLIFTIIGVHAPILYTAGIVSMELSRREGAPISGALRTAGRRAATNPLLIGIALGLLGNVSGINLIEPVDAFTRMMAQAVLPAALFGLGGALNEYRIRDSWTQAASMAGLKLFLQPAIAWLIMVPILNVEHEIARYAVVLAAMPAGINAYVFATSYNRSVDIAANTVLITTASAVLSVSFWLYVMSL